MKDILIAFLTVFIAEMGDKTQLLAFAFASKYRMKQVLFGVLLGSCLNHGIAIVFASFVSKYASVDRLRLAAALMFIVFGLFSLKIDYVEDDEEDDIDRSPSFSPILTVAGAFFLGELGDKTQLAAMTVALASKHPSLILVGTTAAMVTVSLIGILAGKLLGKKIPEVTMKWIASVIFLSFGLTGLYHNAPAKFLQPASVIPFLFLIAAIAALTLYRNKQRRLRVVAQKMARTLSECKECDTHRAACPIGIIITSESRKYLGQKLPYLGRIITYLESMQQVSHEKTKHLRQQIDIRQFSEKNTKNRQ